MTAEKIDLEKATDLPVHLRSAEDFEQYKATINYIMSLCYPVDKNVTMERLLFLVGLQTGMLFTLVQKIELAKCDPALAQARADRSRDICGND